MSDARGPTDLAVLWRLEAILKMRAGFLRRLCAAGCLLVLATGLSGCEELLPGSEEPVPPTSTAEPEPTAGVEPTETPPPGVTTLVFWEPFALDRPQGLLLAEMIRDFETENPDVRVEIVAKSGYVGIHEAIVPQLPDGDLPDIAVAFPSMIAQYAVTGAVIPLDPYINDPEIGLPAEDLADIYPGVLEAGRLPGFDGQLLAFPFVQNAIGMWANQGLLKQAGWNQVPVTWAEFEQACFDVAAATGVLCYPFVESVSNLEAWLYSRGGQSLDASGQQAVFNGPAGVESLALLRRLIDVGLAWRPAEQYGDYVAFANGQAAFAFSSTGNSALYADAYEGALQQGVAPFRWRQTLVPQADPANRATALIGASFFILQHDEARHQAAWRLIRWFTDTAQTARWAENLETMPARISAVAVMTDTLETYPFFQAQVEEILPYSRPEPAVAAGLEVRDLLYTAILSVTQGFADPQTALDQTADKANALLVTGP